VNALSAKSLRDNARVRTIAQDGRRHRNYSATNGLREEKGPREHRLIIFRGSGCSMARDPRVWRYYDRLPLKETSKRRSDRLRIAVSERDSATRSVRRERRLNHEMSREPNCIPVKEIASFGNGSGRGGSLAKSCKFPCRGQLTTSSNVDHKHERISASRQGVPPNPPLTLHKSRAIFLPGKEEGTSGEALPPTNSREILSRGSSEWSEQRETKPSGETPYLKFRWPDCFAKSREMWPR